MNEPTHIAAGAVAAYPELDIPGEVSVATGVIGPGIRETPIDLLADKLFALFVTFIPPLSVALVLALWWSGWYRLSPIEIGLMLGMHFICVVGVEVGFHRLFSHCSYQAHRVVRMTLAALGSMAFEGPVIWWAATHRRHHRTSDKPGDPHSPHLHTGRWAAFRGFMHAHIGWIWVPASMRPPGWARSVNDLYRDRDIFKIHMHYFYWLAAGFVIPGVIGGALHGSWKGAVLGLLWGGPVRVFVMNHLTYWCINSVTHSPVLGRRPFITSDRSTNVAVLAVPTLGQSWHNNHHAFPSSSTMSHAWWQIDIGDWILRALERFGLVWGRKFPTEHQRAKKTRRDGQKS